MPVVSIIMPVFNVEAYLRKSLESVLGQSFADWELFAVDDGSTDGSGDLCDAMARQDARIKALHQENQGSSAARNLGLEHASGKYIYFIDADDWIEPDRIGRMVELAEQYSADLVVTGFKMDYHINHQDMTFRTPCPNRVYDSVEAFRRDAYRYLNNSLLSLPWNKLFRRESVEARHIRFHKTKWPDHHFCMDYLMDCGRVVMSDAEDYHWNRSREGSSTELTYADVNMFKKRVEHYEHVLKLYDHWGIHDQESMNGVRDYFLGRVVQCVQEIAVNPKIETPQKAERVREIIQTPAVREALDHTRCSSRMIQMMSLPIRWRSVGWCLFMGKSIDWVRRAFPSVFVRLKEKEVHGA